MAVAKKKAPIKTKTSQKTRPVVAKKPIAAKRETVKSEPFQPPAVNSASTSPVCPLKKASFFKSSKTLVVLLVILLVAALAYFFKGEFIVATVNGKPITRLALIKNLEKQGGSQVLSSMTLEALARQAIADAKIEISQDEIDAEIAQAEEAAKAQGQDFETLLNAYYGMTKAEYIDSVHLSKQIEALLTDQVAVTDEDAKTYFDQNPDVYEGVAFEDVKDSVIKQLRQEKLYTAQQTWLTDLQNKGNVVYYKFVTPTPAVTTGTAAQPTK